MDEMYICNPVIGKVKKEIAKMINSFGNKNFKNKYS
jgi:hypothetical protein